MAASKKRKKVKISRLERRLRGEATRIELLRKRLGNTLRVFRGEDWLGDLDDAGYCLAWAGHHLAKAIEGSRRRQKLLPILQSNQGENHGHGDEKEEVRGDG